MQIGRIEFAPCAGCLCAGECAPFGTCLKERSAQPATPRLYPPSHPGAMPLAPARLEAGWMCPRCQSVHAPYVPRCHCKPARQSDEAND